MKKLLALAIAIGMFSSLYGLSFGLGAAYDNIAGPEETDAFLSIKADVMCKPLPIVGFRIGLIEFNMPEDATNYHFGTGVNATVLVYIPMAAPVMPYIPLGIFYHSYQDAFSMIDLTAGLGAEMGFGSVSGYLEGGIDWQQISPEVGDSQSENWFFVQAGVRIPVPMD